MKKQSTYKIFYFCKLTKKLMFKVFTCEDQANYFKYYSN